MTPPSNCGRLDSDRQEVERLIFGLPERADGATFDEPWELRAFALVVAAYKNGLFSWTDFQQALINSIAAWEPGPGSRDDPPWSYHEHWVRALEEVMRSNDSLDLDALQERAQQVLDTPANRNHHEPHFEPVAIDPGRLAT